MSKIKKVLFISIIMCLLFTVACSSPDDSKNAITNQENVKKDVSESKDVSKEKENTPEVSVEEKILLDKDGIIITLKSIQLDGMFGTSLKVLVENNTEKSITVQVRDSSINGVMIGAMFSCEVANGKKSNDEITFMNSDIEVAGIKTIKDIELKFHIFDSVSWDGILDTDIIEINTISDPSYVQAYDDSGSVVIDEKGFKIVMKRVNSSDSFWGADVHVYIENNTDLDATIQVRDVSINGFMIDPIFSSEISAGKKVYDTITFLESDLIDNDIKSIDEMELSFHIFETSGWDTIFDTQKVSIIFE